LTADSRGIPGKEVACVIVGGDNQEIAKVLAYTFAMGQEGYGNTQVSLKDDTLMPININFERPTNVQVNVAITLTPTDETKGFLPPDYEAQIKSNILAYAAFTSSTDNASGYPPGRDVVATQLYDAINAGSGRQPITSCTVNGAASVSINWDQVAEFTADTITITLVE
jgi:uncharacterized phage protein gp47/JayE